MNRALHNGEVPFLQGRSEAGDHFKLPTKPSSPYRRIARHQPRHRRHQLPAQRWAYASLAIKLHEQLTTGEFRTRLGINAHSGFR